MITSRFDLDTLTKLFSEATTWQADIWRQAVCKGTLQAVQGRALTLASLRKALTTVVPASSGATQSPPADVDFEAQLSKVFAGMDTSLLQVVQANRRALQQFAEQGADPQENRMKSALANAERVEDVFLATVIKTSQSAGGPLQPQWEWLLNTMKLDGNGVGSQTLSTVEQLIAQSQTALRDGRSIGLRATQAVLDGCIALVSGVLVGVAEGLQRETAAASGRARRRRA